MSKLHVIEGKPRRQTLHLFRLVVLVCALMGPAVSLAANTLTITAVEPTVLFVRESEGLRQVVNVTVENTGEPIQAHLDVSLGQASLSKDLGMLKKGLNELRIQVADVREPTPAEFVLRAEGNVQDCHSMTWRPARHWEVFFVPITHHDLGYTDTIENVLDRYAGFYDMVLQFCDETEDWPDDSKYRYTLEGTWSIQHFVENRPPEAAERLGRYIAEGRIEVGALFGNQISGLCGHEELIRLMYPSFRLQREYGGQILCGSITDVPGLSWGLPTVLAGAGVKYFFAGLPTYFEWGRNDIHTFWDEPAILRHGRPDAFRWKGPDGSSVLVYYQGSYGFFDRVIGPDSYQEVSDHLPGMLTALENQNSPFSVMRYIHNGVDNYPPDVAISHVVRQWNSKWAYPKLIVGTNSMFFQALEKQCGDVRTFSGELPHTDYAVGATSTASQTSRNRLTHDKILSAEKAATIASLVSERPYPMEKIRTVYDNMLLYDEHTWGKDYPTGQIQDLAWHEKSHYAYRAASITESLLSESLSHLAHQIDLPDRRGHVVVFNSLSNERTDVVRVSRFHKDKPFDLIDPETDRKIPYQITELAGPLSPLPYAANRHARGQYEPHELHDLVFVADHVPPLGYKTYQMVARDQWPVSKQNLSVEGHTLENQFFKVVLDENTGAVAEIHDKGQRRQLVDRTAPHHVNQLVTKWVQTGQIEASQGATLSQGSNGPIYASVISHTSGPGCPQIIQETRLYHGIKRIDFANRVLKDSTPLQEIYFAFPFQVENPQFRFEGSNSVIEPLKDQFPGSNSNYYSVQHWARVGNGQGGIVLSGIDSHLMEFGGIWPCYVSQAHHGFTPPGFGQDFVTADQLEKGHIYAFVMDNNFRTNFQPVQQGNVLFRYSMTTHAGDGVQSECRNFGWSVSNPLMGIALNGEREGPLEPRGSFCQVDKPNVMILTIKRAEDGPDLIVRLIETEGQPAAVELTLPHVTIGQAWQANLVEANQRLLDHTEHTVNLRATAYGISTVRLKVRP